MTDIVEIVERLRDYARNCGGPPEEYLTWQAADEIERLETANEYAFGELAKLRAEIERLRMENNLLRGKIIGQSWSSELPDSALEHKP